MACYLAFPGKILRNFYPMKNEQLHNFMVGEMFNNIKRKIYRSLSPPGIAYMRRWTGSTLVHVMACRLSALSHYMKQCCLIVNWTLGNKPQWNSNRKKNPFHSSKWNLKVSPAKWRPFCPGGDELIGYYGLFDKKDSESTFVSVYKMRLGGFLCVEKCGHHCFMVMAYRQLGTT